MNKSKTPEIYDPSLLSVTAEPYTKFSQRITSSKYDAIFSEVGENQRLRCPSQAAARLASQLRKWLEARGHTNIITRARTNCGDGFGGVWWMKESKPVGTVLAANAPWPTAKKKAAR